MIITLNPTLAASVAAAVRLHALAIRESTDEMQRLLNTPLACVKNVDLEVTRIAKFRVEIDALLTLAQLIQLKISQDE